MSLAGKNTAIVSIGSSCQTAYQVRNHAGLLSRLCGDDLRTRRLPFDWVICSPRRAAGWVDSGLPFPEDPGDLAPYKHEGVFRWGARGVFFWHDFRNEQKLVDLPGTFEFTQIKYRALRESFRNLSDLDRVVLIISNTQNNLPKVLGDDFSGEGFDFAPGNLNRLKESIEAFLGRPCELLAVTYADRSDTEPERDASSGMRVFTIDKNTSGWAGDDASWHDIFLAYFTGHAAC
jgi:hypothetical protein